MEQNAAKKAQITKPTAIAIPSTLPRGSRWQLIAASVMLALWILFLVVMALNS